MTLAAATTGKGLIDQVQKALGERSPAAQLVPLLYGNGLDGLDLPPARLAEDALAVLEFIAEKPQKAHKLRVRSVQGPDGSAEGSVVEILNDDMPFLVDSVMGELQARGLAVRLLLHPIFKTRRDKAGRLQAVVGPGDQNWSDGHQESYIAIHLPGLVRRPCSVISLPRSPGSWARCVRRSRTGRPCCGQLRAADRGGRGGAGARSGRRQARGGRVPALARGGQFHVPRRARLPARRHAGDRQGS